MLEAAPPKPRSLVQEARHLWRAHDCALRAVARRVFWILSVGVYVMHGQQVSEIVTDRPDVTEASTVVPKDSLQIENGFTQTSDHGTETLDLSESLVRYGLADRTELRFDVPNLFFRDAGGQPAPGLSGLSFGVKQQLGPLPGNFDVAVIAALSFPTGTKNESGRGFDPFIKLPWSRPLTEKWSFGGMVSAFWETVDYRHRFLWEPTFYLERELTKKTDAFAEFAGDYFANGSKRVYSFRSGIPVYRKMPAGRSLRLWPNPGYTEPLLRSRLFFSCRPRT
jgi:hypothetical protein